MSGSRQERLERWATVIATAACLLFVLGLRDTRLRIFSEAAWAPGAPADSGYHDAELNVQVTDRAGQSIPGAALTVYWEDERSYYFAGRGKTDPSGRIALRALPRGPSVVLVEAPGYARTSLRLLLGGDPQAARVILEKARQLRVQVRDEQGAALPGATVLVTGQDALPFGKLTSAQGLAEFDRLGPEPWSVKASAAGYESVTQNDVSQDLEITLRRLGSLNVRVEDEAGATVPGAHVLIAGSALWPARRATTGSDGVARITALLSGVYDLRAVKGSRVSDTLFAVQLDKGEHKQVVLTLRQGRMVTAVVTDGEAENALVVQNADVVLVESGLSSFPLRGRTGADGSVVLGPLPPGPSALAARAEGFVPRGAVPVPETLTERVRIPLLRGATLKGEVVDEQGYPVIGASIEVIGTDVHGLPVAETPMLMNFRRTHFAWSLQGPVPLIPMGELGVMPGPVPPIPTSWLGVSETGSFNSAGAAALSLEGEDIAPWVTTPSGEFVAHPVTPGRVRALIRHPDYVETVSEAVTLAPGAEGKVKVVMFSGGRLEGRVVDHRGYPVEGARVDVQAVQGTYERSAISDPNGEFEFAAAPREVMLSVARPEDPSKLVMRTGTQVPEGGRQEIELQLPEPREPVSVEIVDDRGMPVDAAQVTVLSLDARAPLRQTLFTTSDGRVTIDDARGLKVRIQVEGYGWARAVRVVAEAPETVQIPLSRGVIVVGSITAVRGRRAVEGAQVTLLSDGVRKLATSDASGTFRFEDVSPGAAKLSINHPEYAEAHSQVVIEATGRADRPFELPSIDLSQAGGVSGTVVDSAGRPVMAARVAVGVAPAYLPAGALPPGVAVTDSQGRFRLMGLEPKSLTLEAYAAGVGRGRAQVQVEAESEVTDIVIRLADGGADSAAALKGSIAVTLGERGSQATPTIVIVHVAPASEAERAGLRPGDVLIAIDEVEPRDMLDARTRLSGPAGSDVLIEVLRDQSPVELRVSREQVRH